MPVKVKMPLASVTGATGGGGDPAREREGISTLTPLTGTPSGSTTLPDTVNVGGGTGVPPMLMGTRAVITTSSVSPGDWVWWLINSALMKSVIGVADMIRASKRRATV